MTAQITNPLNPTEEILIEREIDTKYIISGYIEQYGFDVSKYFLGREKIKLFRCVKSGYRFFFPFNICGDSRFYEALSRDTYYNKMSDKWEHKIAKSYLIKSDKVLEVGCGHGLFLQQLVYAGIDIVGLELNKTAVDFCLKNKLNVYRQELSDYAKENPDRHDVVCAIQVLEHIAKPIDFLLSALETLRSGGKLIISVPNNDSFIKNDPLNLLNLPPHHLGLWNRSSLETLQILLPIKIISIKTEPLAIYHVRYYFEVLIGNYLQRGFGYLGKAIRLIIILPFCGVIYLCSPWIIGHTILAVYEKK